MGTKGSAAGTEYFQAFVCAGVPDLCRLVELKEFCPGPAMGRPRISADLPRVPAVAHLALYMLLLTRGLQPKHTVVYPHRKRLRDLLRRIYRKAIANWDRGELQDGEELQLSVRALAKFARKNFGPFENPGTSLQGFGVTSVRQSLAILTEKLAMLYARNITRRLAKDPESVPPEVLGGSLVASATSPGVVERLGDGHTIGGLMKLGVRTGLMGASSRGAGKQAPAALDDLRKFLKRAGRELQR